MGLAMLAADTLRTAPRDPAPRCDEALLSWLHALGARQAFGLVGGAIARLCDALGRSALEAFHLRHEAGALFAATEASLATGRPTVCFVTTGPGLTNAITGVMAARHEGARVVLLSGFSSAPQRGRGAVQESTHDTLPAGLYTAGALFDYAAVVEHPSQLAVVAQRLAEGMRRPEGFVAHVALPVHLQALDAPRMPRPVAALPSELSVAGVAEAAARLQRGPFVIWVGHGARGAAREVRALAEHTGAWVMSTPRAKGIFPEDHPQHLGVTGCGGHERVERALAALSPSHVLVLGSRLGEFSSCWSEALLPRDGLVHVDVDPTAFGAAYPQAETLGVVADIAPFLRALLPAMPPGPKPAPMPPAVLSAVRAPSTGESVHPEALLDALQARVVEGSDATVMAESGNAFAWANHNLRFRAPGRYRVSGQWGSMGHCTSGVVGAALARREKAVALVGDGAMLMMNEVSSAVQHRAPAVWVVLNDARMGIVEKGMVAIGLSAFQTEHPPTDFAALARALGAAGEVVTREEELADALDRAMNAVGPYVLDVRVTPGVMSPVTRRFSVLAAMSAGR